MVFEVTGLHCSLTFKTVLKERGVGGVGGVGGGGLGGGRGVSVCVKQGILKQGDYCTVVRLF